MEPNEQFTEGGEKASALTPAQRATIEYMIRDELRRAMVVSLHVYSNVYMGAPSHTDLPYGIDLDDEGWLLNLINHVARSYAHEVAGAAVRNHERFAHKQRVRLWFREHAAQIGWVALVLLALVAAVALGYVLGGAR